MGNNGKYKAKTALLFARNLEELRPEKVRGTKTCQEVLFVSLSAFLYPFSMLCQVEVCFAGLLCGLAPSSFEYYYYMLDWSKWIIMYFLFASRACLLFPGLLSDRET